VLNRPVAPSNHKGGFPEQQDNSAHMPAKSKRVLNRPVAPSNHKGGFPEQQDNSAHMMRDGNRDMGDANKANQMMLCSSLLLGLRPSVQKTIRNICICLLNVRRSVLVSPTSVQARVYIYIYIYTYIHINIYIYLIYIYIYIYIYIFQDNLYSNLPIYLPTHHLVYDPGHAWHLYICICI
jgi:hypothetical protein